MQVGARRHDDDSDDSNDAFTAATMTSEDLTPRRTSDDLTPLPLRQGTTTVCDDATMTSEDFTLTPDDLAD